MSPAFRPRPTGRLPGLAPGTCVSQGYEVTRGFGFPTALGVKVPNPGKAVVSITGDGGFNMSIGDLETARRIGVTLTVVVVNKVDAAPPGGAGPAGRR